MYIFGKSSDGKIAVGKLHVLLEKNSTKQQQN